MKRAILLVLPAIAVLLVSAVLVGAGATRGVDLAATVFLQSFASVGLDLIANANTPLGQATVTPVIAAALAIVLWRRGPPWAWLAVGAFAVVVLVGYVLKLALVHPPPPPELVRTAFNPLGIRIETPGAFPSGHVARVTFLLILASVVLRATWQRLMLALVLAWTFWARIYLGDHWLSDAVGGVALGVASGCVALGWVSWCRMPDRRP